MSFRSKFSKSAVEGGGRKWTCNLKATTKRRPTIPDVNQELNEVKCRMPSNRDIVGRFVGLFCELKGRQDRITRISEELLKLWEKMNFPFLSKQQVSAKVDKLIKSFEKYRKRNNEQFAEKLHQLFDITKSSGNWLCVEDKELYRRQIESGGRTGYTTEKVAPMSTIHPSKRPRRQSSPSTSQAVACESSSGEKGNSSSNESDPEIVHEEYSKKRKYQSTKVAAKLVSKQSLSTRKASGVLQSLAEEGVDVPTPSQSGVWRRVIRNAEQVKNRLKEIISEEKFCLHFDGKRIGNKEYQVVCLTNPTRTLHLGILACKSGSAEDIFVPLQALLDEYNAWNCVRMIVSDTTAVNTGRKSGIVIRLQREFREKGLEEPQFIGCQHHVLDLILRHVLDSFFPTKTQSPNINYKFIDEVLAEYDELQAAYSGTAVIPEQQNLGWRDDFKFLFELCESYKFHEKEKKWPKITWRKLPSLHSARWNSRGIFALIAFFLLPKLRDQLKVACNFVANMWAQAWFSNQHYSENVYDELFSAVSELKCSKAVNCFSTHWKREPSVLDVPRSNIVAERGVKLMEELHATCKTDKYLSCKFINSNSQI